jgi:histone deacetylase complex regulatory component SIN3
LICYDENGQLKVIDKVAFRDWLNKPELKHNSKLNYENECVQMVIKKFTNVDPLKLYNYLRMFYWTKCTNIIQFEKIIKNKLDEINNIEELFNEAI